MKNYLSELLTDPNKPEVLLEQKINSSTTKPLAHKDNQSLEQLLKTVNKPKESVINPSNKEGRGGIDLLPIASDKSGTELTDKKNKNYRKGDFQVMFFDVAGLIIAVPLIELGGIYKVGKTTKLMGKPNWFKGVMIHRDEKINVVDTALWVMPEKCDEKLKESLNYQYIIMLNDSSWGLMAENLIDTVILSQDEVKWLDSNNKRPWLAGLVKKKMCALLDVTALIQLLDKGNDISQVRS
ncbi:chemotaxis protein CheW [Colwellia ponticola]|uniref:Chemotaxis protein CheW n=2 Tax=Colwellia ponticola TaxID=2304625 RepID=A0A8H2JNZ2_9GAMM|nr:chemotaxis protein CheW [Colwellia ponticola]